MKENELKEQLSTLPNAPGVYKYYGENEVIIYIGKAKNIRKRVASYFNKKQFENAKTRVLVSKIKRIEFAVVNNEMEALLLENNLIKQHQPRYNILLKDDKSFPLIRITNERFPRVFAMRNPKYDGSQFFGPYTSARSMHVVLDLIKNLYPLRNCNLNLTPDNIEKGKFKACLEYQLGNCNAPCIGKESEEAYMHSIKKVKEILRGNLSEVRKELTQNMLGASDDLRFEEAAKQKQKLDMLEHFVNKSTVVSHQIKNVDVFHLSTNGKQAYVCYLKVDNGMVTRTKSVEYKMQLEEEKEDVLIHAILGMRERYDSDAREIIVPFEVELPLENIKFTIPKAGDKKKLLELAMKNVLFYKKQKLENYEKLNPSSRVDRLMERMQKDLNLTEEPRHIECFDNSNFQGSLAVSACVVFVDGKPSKKDYRHFNVKTVEGPDDFATMKEVVGRRYTRMLKEEQPLPQLIVVDGGKGQLSSAVEALKELDLYGKIAIIGIAKRLEEIYFPSDPVPLHIDKTSETLKVIQHMRDEAHRFGITHHRGRRSKQALSSELVDIPGVGPKTIDMLLKTFKSVKKIRKIQAGELEPVIGKDKAERVYEYFQKHGA